VNCIDGIRLEPLDAWLLIRRSGTESAIRIVAEAESKERAHALLTRAKEMVEIVLRSMDTPSPVSSFEWGEVGPAANCRRRNRNPEEAPR